MLFSDVCSKSLQSCLTLCNPVDCSPPGFSVHGDSPGKNTKVRCHALLQGIVLIQEANSSLLSPPALCSGFLTTSSTWVALLFVLRKSVNWCLYSHCLTCHSFLHALHFLAYVYNIFEILKKSMRFLPTSMRKIQMCINCDVLISLFLKCRTIY